MPQRRKRKNHPNVKRSEVSASQRTSGHFLWALLFAAFAGLIGFFAAGSTYIVIIICAAIGGVLGYIIGRKMERL
jgi:membrane protein YqaA with SNARE-associated domain